METQAERLVDKLRQGHGERSNLIERQTDCRGFAGCVNKAENNRAAVRRDLAGRERLGFDVDKGEPE